MLHLKWKEINRGSSLSKQREIWHNLASACRMDWREPERSFYNANLIKSFPFHSMASFCFQEKVQTPEQKLRWLFSLISTLLQDWCSLPTICREGFLFYSSLPLALNCQVLLILLKRLSNLLSPFHSCCPYPRSAFFKPFLVHLPKQNISLLLFLIIKAIRAHKKKIIMQ